MLRLDPKAIKACSYLTADTGDMRTYLHGVFVEVRDDAVRYVATDGSGLLAVLGADKPDPEWVGRKFILPPSALPEMGKTKWINVANAVPVPGGDALDLTYEMYKFGARSCRTLEGRFPDWRAVVPVELSGEARQYNGVLLRSFAQAWRALKDDSSKTEVFCGACLRLLPNGDRPAVVRFPVQEAVGLIMPLLPAKNEADMVTYTRPAWL